MHWRESIEAMIDLLEQIDLTPEDLDYYEYKCQQGRNGWNAKLFADQDYCRLDQNDSKNPCKRMYAGSQYLDKNQCTLTYVGSSGSENNTVYVDPNVAHSSAGNNNS
jgi:hypothetical protein